MLWSLGRSLREGVDRLMAGLPVFRAPAGGNDNGEEARFCRHAVWTTSRQGGGGTHARALTRTAT